MPQCPAQASLLAQSLSELAAERSGMRRSMLSSRSLAIVVALSCVALSGFILEGFALESPMKRLGWLGRIRYTRSTGGVWYPCSGVAITPHHILAPAHCVMFLGKGDSFSFMAGRERHTVSRVYIHPEYRLESLAHDVAVLRLHHKSGLSSCLALTESGSYESLVAQRFDVASTSAGRHPMTIHAQAKVTGHSYCQSKFTELQISENEVCAYLLHPHNEFLNGAALLGIKMLNGAEAWHLLGISTHGPYERNNKMPDLFTLIAPYAKWIKNITKLH